MFRRKLTAAQWLILAGGIVIALLCTALCLRFSTPVRSPLYDTAVRAAERMQACMDSVRAEKLSRGIEIPPEDRFETGLIGEDFNFITTTLGDIAAKRTTTDPDMAAMMVFMLDEAGLKEGDVLGCNFSGSFPALNIAVLCACEETGITPVYVCSCGASTWGGNNPGFCFPEMAVLLYEQGLISTAPALITPGGGDDAAGGVDSDMFSEIWDRVSALGYPVMFGKEYSGNLNARLELYDSADIDCFISVGGNITSLGNNMIVDVLGQGILDTEVPVINSGSGLLEIYLHRGVPTILLLNIRQLMTDYGLPFDPDSRSAPGVASIYYTVQRPLYYIWTGLAAELLLAFLFGKAGKQPSPFRSERRKRNEEKTRS